VNGTHVHGALQRVDDLIGPYLLVNIEMATMISQRFGQFFGLVWR
jgi:hypothetical protein